MTGEYEYTSSSPDPYKLPTNCIEYALDELRIYRTATEFKELIGYLHATYSEEPLAQALLHYANYAASAVRPVDAREDEGAFNTRFADFRSGALVAMHIAVAPFCDPLEKRTASVLKINPLEELLSHVGTLYYIEQDTAIMESMRVWMGVTNDETQQENIWYDYFSKQTEAYKDVATKFAKLLHEQPDQTTYDPSAYERECIFTAGFTFATKTLDTISRRSDGIRPQ